MVKRGSKQSCYIYSGLKIRRYARDKSSFNAGLLYLNLLKFECIELYVLVNIYRFPESYKSRISLSFRFEMLGASDMLNNQLGSKPIDVVIQMISMYIYSASKAIFCDIMQMVKVVCKFLSHKGPKLLLFKLFHQGYNFCKLLYLQILNESRRGGNGEVNFFNICMHFF